MISESISHMAKMSQTWRNVVVKHDEVIEVRQVRLSTPISFREETIQVTHFCRLERQNACHHSVGLIYANKFTSLTAAGKQ